jgi:NAD(P)-dependent dehydrogenase (short-subunit alcohol dehydrogenase family)
MSEEQIGEILDTNLKGAILGCKFFGKRMIARKGGCIVNVSSLHARKGVAGASVYAASKAGMLGESTTDS